MNAIIYRSYGGPEKLELVQRPDPQPGPGQLLIRVHCSSVNPIDWKRASGVMRLFSPVPMPGTPGYDIAGVVEAVGGYAELAVAGIDVSTQLPESMSFADGAALPLAGMTALQGLHDYCGLPLTGALSGALAPVSGADAATLAAIGQMGSVWTGGGTLIPWSSLIAIACFARVPVQDAVRVMLVPVVTGLVASTFFAVAVF
jgi:NADPH:quinone reductase-like Zn-dependent oxidoreductase